MEYPAFSVSTESGFLQWGRAQVSAEIQSHEWHHHNADGPSMGPRSGERGNLNEVTKARMAFFLQWRRAQVSAEIAMEENAASLLAKPSMGPRAGERGNTPATRPILAAFAPFNGAALR